MGYRKEIFTDNKGSTLIEIIVCILIIGIVFVPLMMGLDVAFKSNAKTENEIYAENVATNCIEVAKTYGNATGGFGVPNSAKAISQDASIVLSSGIYTVTGIKEGTRTYSAEVTFDSSKYETGQNNFDGFKSIATIAKAVSFSLNKLNSTTTFDDDARDKAAERAYNNNEDGLQLGALSNYEDRVDEFFESKQTIITIGQKAVDDPTDPGRYYVTRRIVYTLKEKIGTKDIVPSGQRSIEYTITDPTTYVSCPENIVLFITSPKINSDGSIDTDFTGYSDKLLIEKNVVNEIKVYCICAGAPMEVTGSSQAIDINLSCPGSGEGTYLYKIEGETTTFYTSIFSNLRPSAASDTSKYSKLDDLSGGIDETNKKMYDITVKVFDATDTVNPVLTKTATVVQNP